MEFFLIFKIIFCAEAGTPQSEDLLLESRFRESVSCTPPLSNLEKQPKSKDEIQIENMTLLFFKKTNHDIDMFTTRIKFSLYLFFESERLNLRKQSCCLKSTDFADQIIYLQLENSESFKTKICNQMAVFFMQKYEEIKEFLKRIEKKIRTEDIPELGSVNPTSPKTKEMKKDKDLSRENKKKETNYREKITLGYEQLQKFIKEQFVFWRRDLECFRSEFKEIIEKVKNLEEMVKTKAQKKKIRKLESENEKELEECKKNEETLSEKHREHIESINKKEEDFNESMKKLEEVLNCRY